MELEVNTSEVLRSSEKVDSVYTEHTDPTFLALQPHLPNHIKAARIIQAHGHNRHYPPKGGRKVNQHYQRCKTLDEIAIRAICSAVNDFILASEVDSIIKTYKAEENGDAFNVAGHLEFHPYIVIAVLRNLKREGRLPAHPSSEAS